jgi:hypothetical protein
MDKSNTPKGISTEDQLPTVEASSSAAKTHNENTKYF